MPVTRERLFLLLALMLGVGLIVYAAVALTYGKFAELAETREAKRELALHLRIHKDATERYFAELGSDAEFLAQSRIVIDALVALNGAWGLLGNDERRDLRRYYSSPAADNAQITESDDAWGDTDGNLYQTIHDDFHDGLRLFVEDGGFSDLLIMNPVGDIIYSVAKETDFGHNVGLSIYMDTALEAAVPLLAGAPPDSTSTLIDFNLHVGQDVLPIAFAVAPVFAGNGRYLGTIALKVRGETVESIARFGAEFEDAAETYLVGGDFKVRSSRHSRNADVYLLNQHLEENARRAMQGVSAVVSGKNLSGEATLTGYAPITAMGTAWALIVEVPAKIVHARVNAQKLHAYAGLAGAGAAAVFGILVANVALFANRRLTRRDIERLKESWGRIKNQKDFGEYFFVTLFQRDPSLRALFHADIDRQAGRFVRMIDHLVNNLENMDKQRMPLQRLGRDHAELGVRLHSFEVFGASLISALNSYRDLNLSALEQDSWADFYFVICQEMAAGIAT